MMGDKHNAFDFKVDRILEEGSAYSRESYYFIKDAVAFAQEVSTRKASDGRHLTIQELVESIRVFALCEYGPMAKSVLNSWGVMKTKDFGTLIFRLADVGELELSDSDSIDQFKDVYDFDTAFTAPFVPNFDHVGVPVLDEE